MARIQASTITTQLSRWFGYPTAYVNLWEAIHRTGLAGHIIHGYLRRYGTYQNEEWRVDILQTRQRILTNQQEPQIPIQ